MPDWSYQPLFRPLLFCLPAEQARDLTLGALGVISRLPGGYGLIAALGHMHPPAGLHRPIGGVHFLSPVGLGAGLDEHHVALGALARFGCGFIEVGPVTQEPVTASGAVARDPANQAILYPAVRASGGLTALKAALVRAGPLPLPIGARLACTPAGESVPIGAEPQFGSQELQSLIQSLRDQVHFFTLDLRQNCVAQLGSADAWLPQLRAICQWASPCPVWLCLSPDLAEGTIEAMTTAATAAKITGFWLCDDLPMAYGRTSGPANQAAAVALVQTLRARWGDQLPICAAGGVTEPWQAAALLAAGAQLVQVQSGLVYGGPGLFKRINEALFVNSGKAGSSADSSSEMPAASRGAAGLSTWPTWLRPGWLWAFLLGVGMMIGGLLVWVVAETRVLLPYDEAFVQLTQVQLAAVNANLLAFMRHDRVTLAGTMLSIGILYSMLAWHGLRWHCHWAWRTLLWSGAVGFASFFLFLGFGYFDPLHALVSLLLLPLFVLGMLGDYPAPPVVRMPDWHNDRQWRQSLWGQAIFVGLGFGLIVGGAVIATIGTTSVFVHEDLAFMQVTASELAQASPNLVPLIAHDRAGFGGALVANGLAVLCSALWGFRRGAAWLWWMFLGAGLSGFGAALYTHWAVGYTNWLHLAPLWIGLILFGIGLQLAWSYLVDYNPQQA